MEVFRFSSAGLSRRSKKAAPLETFVVYQGKKPLFG